MKRFPLAPLASFALLALGGAPLGCQVKPNPTSYSCQGIATYTPLNATASPSLSVADTPSAGTYCYVVQAASTAFTPTLYSPASDPTTPFTVTGTQQIALTITPPTAGVTPTGYIVSRAAAISVTILAPAVSGTQSAMDTTPFKPIIGFISKNEMPRIHGVVASR